MNVLGDLLGGIKISPRMEDKANKGAREKGEPPRSLADGYVRAVDVRAQDIGGLPPRTRTSGVHVPPPLALSARRVGNSMYHRTPSRPNGDPCRSVLSFAPLGQLQSLPKPACRLTVENMPSRYSTHRESRGILTFPELLSQSHFRSLIRPLRTRSLPP